MSIGEELQVTLEREHVDIVKSFILAREGFYAGRMWADVGGLDRLGTN